MSTEDGKKEAAALSPFYLHPSDGPGNLITTVQLRGENYEDWSKHVRNALRTKRKLGFIDGTLEKPSTVTEIEQWEVVNSMLVAWIMNTIEPTLKTSISMVDEVKLLWDDLKLQFSAGNGPRISELRAEIANSRQGGDSVMVYFGRLKKMWDELAVYKPIRTCSCGEVMKQLEEDRDEERTNTFLNGLDSVRFGTVRSTITSMEPLPKLPQVYQRIVREERQQSIVRGRDEHPNAVGFAVSAGHQSRAFPDREKDVTCTNCGKYGHAVSDCYQLKGFPEWWGERGRNFRGRGGARGGGRFARGGGMVGNSAGRGRGNTSTGRAHAVQAAHAGTKNEEVDRNCLPNLTDDQWTALKQFLGTKKPESVDNLTGTKDTVEFIIDTGASHHMTWKLDLLSNILDIFPCSIGLPDGDRAIAIKQGDICLGGDLWLRGVLYSPELKCSLISVAKLLKTTKGSITFTEDLCFLQDRTTKTLIGAGEECGGVYVFRGVMGAQAQAAASMGVRDLWHRRLGHPSSRILSYLSSQVDVGKPAETEVICDTCFRAKQTRDCFHESSNKATELFALIHCDVWGAYRTLSSSGAAYFLTIVDDFSRAVWIYLLKEKREVADSLKKFCAMVERQFDKRVRVVRSDNGSEFMCLKSFFEHEGILHQTSCVYTPQQNGRVERKHRHILNVARSLMFQASLPISFWGECVLTAAHLINRTPSTLLNGKTPYEFLYSSAPHFDKLKVFGCLCYTHKKSRDKDKFGARSQKCVFVGYSYGQKGWRVYDLEKKEYFVSRDVVFYETEFPFARTDVPVSSPLLQTSPPRPHEDEDFLNVPSTSQIPDERGSSHDVVMMENHTPGGNEPIVTEPRPLALLRDASETERDRSIDPEPRSIDPAHTNETIHETWPIAVNEQTQAVVTAELGVSKRPKSKPQRLNDYVLYTTQCTNDPSPHTPTSASSTSGTVPYPISNYVTCERFSDKHRAFLAAVTAAVAPTTYAEAVQLKIWCDAMSLEIGALEENDTWYITELPPGKKALGCRWVYTIKHHSDGTIERYKARLVIRGDRQIAGKDFEETFAPVAKMTTIRMFLKVVAAKQWEVHQMDVHNAFLHGDLEEEVYMTLPPGFRSSGTNQVLRLRKSLYGLRQAPRCWFAKLTNALLRYGFVQTYSDYSLFYLARGDMRLYVLVYVDDLLIGGNDSGAISRFKEYLSACFKMKDLGPLKYFLGIEVARSPEGIYLSQRKYTLDIIDECGMLASRPITTPIEENHHLQVDEEGPYSDPGKYRRLVGRLVYLSVTRPELSYVIHVLTQFLQKPHVKHWAAALRVVRYLKSCPGQGIMLTADSDLKLSAYCDSDHAACPLTRRSLTGYVVLLGGSPIAWKTKKQKTVSLSSAEAEYRSMRHTTCELKWNHELLSCFGITHDGPISLFCDSQAALHIAANPVFHERTKHIEVDCHFVRDAIQAGLIATFKVHTSNQLADMLTKALGSPQFLYLLRKLGIYDLHAPT